LFYLVVGVECLLLAVGCDGQLFCIDVSTDKIGIYISVMDICYIYELLGFKYAHHSEQAIHGQFITADWYFPTNWSTCQGFALEYSVHCSLFFAEFRVGYGWVPHRMGILSQFRHRI
jgi:hypothetical protein